MRKKSITILSVLAFAVLAAACSQQADIGITTKVKSLLDSDRTVSNAAQIQVTTENKVVTLAGPVESPATKEHAVTLARGVEGVKKVVDKLTVAPASVANAQPEIARVPVTDAQPSVAPGSAADAKPSVAPGPVAKAQPSVAPAPVAKAQPSAAPAPIVADAKPVVAPIPVAPIPIAEAQPVIAKIPVAEAKPAVEAAPGTGTAPTDASITQAVKEKLLLQPGTSSRNIDVDTHEGVVTLSGTVKSPQEKEQVIQIARGTEGVQRVDDKLSVSTS
jgi:osmotically-inducible protein OsmY